MKASRVLAGARKGVPTLRAPAQQNRLFTSSPSSASVSVSVSSSPAIISSQACPRRRPLLPPCRSVAVAGGSLPVRSRRTYASAPQTESPLKKTPLYDLHVAHGAKMVPFGGYSMPVQYAGQSVVGEHTFTREHASLFDVGHMVQHRFEGPGATAFLQRVTPAGLEKLAPHSGTLSVLLWPGTGGIVDDTIVTKLGSDDAYYVVTNAACRDKDLAYLAQHLGQWAEEGRPAVEHTVLEGQGLVALQGPRAASYLAHVLADPDAASLSTLYFGQCRTVSVQVAGGRTVPDVLVSRGGYTGEDGFEISIAPEETAAVTQALLQAAPAPLTQTPRLAGLGARDSLRLEAGMCLYGHDLDDTTTPVEGALAWVVAKERRAETDLRKGAFYGADVVLQRLTPRSKGGLGVERRRVGLVVEGAPAREGAEILDAQSGEKVGVVTSGCPSPSLGRNIAMGYVRDGLHKAGTEVQVLVRGRRRGAVVTKMPFLPSKYYKSA
ncbi:glycine cleavage system T protein [Hypoxylon sp. NC1633]|nr:glycine cleavage system T protein [Hypoxylon sp. NC1633]